MDPLTSKKVSEFVSDPPPPPTTRESQLGRELLPAVSQHQDLHHSHHLQQHHQQSYHSHSRTHHSQENYKRYSPNVPADYREWRPASADQESHSPGQSPHSHTSVSLTGSLSLHPSSHNSGIRRDSDTSFAEHLVERLREKREKKRLRLTDNETRFLMGEFARQPHPDAAHRERIARGIPGLTPGQVQVWFLNRRAQSRRSRDLGEA